MDRLSDSQNVFYSEIKAWMKTDRQSYVLAGYAGTGKTTVAQAIEQEIGKVITCAFTGKAASVLREKGSASAGTIHGYLYRPKSTKGKKPQFKLNEDSSLADARLVIVDEYSMLDKKLIGDLRKVCKKILYLGDPFQLPPVSGECPLKPNGFMTEIHRQALDSPIIRAATAVREGRSLEFIKGGDFEYLERKDTTPELYTAADQVIVGRNLTRTTWNARFRSLLGYDSELPMVGEKMICLKNNHEQGLFNGMIDEVKEKAYRLNNGNGSGDYVLSVGDFYDLRIFGGDIRGKGADYNFNNPHHKGLERFDYAYTITCHKSQGSEFDNVVVYNEPIGRGVEAQRWLYTALTRSKKRCTLVEP